MEEPVICDRDTVKIDGSKCAGRSLGIAPYIAKYLKDLGFYVIIIDPFAEENEYDANEVIKGEVFSISDELIKGNYVIVSTKHVYDTWAIMKSVLAGAKAIQVVMSIKRARIILGRLIKAGISKEELRRLRIPAGLDIGSKTEKEIALSIVAEILTMERGTSGLPLSKVKEFEKVVDEL
ncbi:hypothetical protein HS5_23210 [Acidianus sp. HS-5]|nr:hypothetical protein HS5_23210 [Acidianus sp. HS-5]